MGRVIVITSGKGGTGKTTACAAISSCLAVLGHRTLAVDCDIGLRNLDISLGMSDFAVSDISDVAGGRAGISEAAHEHPELKKLFFLASPLYRTDAGITAGTLGGVFRKAREQFEYVLVDSPAGLGAGFGLAAGSADEAIIVATGDPASVRNAARTVETLAEMGITNARLLINRVNKLGWSKYRTTVDDIIDTANARLIGLVRSDDAVPAAAADDAPLVLYETGGAARDFLDAARRLRGEDIPLR